MRKIVVDMMGSDLGSKITVEAVKLFHAKHPDYELICVGKQEELTSLDFAKVIDARDVVPMNAGAMEVIRKKESSMVIALNTAVKEKADGVISAGATGGFLSAATLILKKIDGVKRPALVTSFPNLNKEGQYVTILDVGASNENTAEELIQFAHMGSIYSKAVYKIDNPTVKLLANGTEEGKGSPLGKETYKLLKEDKKINFQGNIEGSQILMGAADVVVTDGYTGNVMLKSVEGTAKSIGKLLKKGFTKNLKTKLGYLLAKSVVTDFKRLMDPKNVGGAMLLGINGIAVKAHGNSDAESFYSAMEVEYKMIEANIVPDIVKAFKEEEE